MHRTSGRGLLLGLIAKPACTSSRSPVHPADRPCQAFGVLAPEPHRRRRSSGAGGGREYAQAPVVIDLLPGTTMCTVCSARLPVQ